MTESAYDKRRMYKSEPYLRAEHLLKDGRYASTNIQIKDIVYDCPKKKIGSPEMGKMIGLAFEGTDKVLGLCATNESMVAFVLGNGHPPSWIGKKILLVVRLAGNKKEPAIRVWPGKGNPHPNNRVREQMGDPITEEWYSKHEASGPEGEPPEPKKIQEQKKPAEPKKFTAEERAEWLKNFDAKIAAARTTTDIDECRSSFTKLGPYLEKHSTPLTEDERKRIAMLIQMASESAVAPASNDKPEGTLL